MNVEEMAWADVAKTKLDLIYPHSAPLDANMTKSEAVARIDEFDVVAIDVDLDGDNDRDVDGDPIDTSDMGRGGEAATQDIENSIGNDERSIVCRCVSLEGEGVRWTICALSSIGPVGPQGRRCRNRMGLP
jgi:hypothetical protein